MTEPSIAASHHTLELLLLVDPAVIQARVFNPTLSDGDAQWIVAVTLTDDEEDDQQQLLELVQTLRERLAQSMKSADGESALPDKWYLVEDFPLKDDGSINDDQLRLMIVGEDDGGENVICLDFSTTPLTRTNTISLEPSDGEGVSDSRMVTESDTIEGNSLDSDCTDDDESTGRDDTEGSESPVVDWDLKNALDYNRETPEIVRACIHELFEAQAHDQPDAIAIDSWDGQLTYQQLNSASNRLATHLTNDHSVQVGDLVHVCFEKSVWFFVSILAINKAGAAWVPLEPSDPVRRQKQIVQQTRARLALVSSSNASKCAELVSDVLAVTGPLNRRLTQRFGPAPSAPTVIVTPNQPAYVMFTSARTGKPKGFVMEHGGVCTSQTAIAERLGLTPGVRILQFASYVFDLCIGEILAPLITGATVCVASEHTQMDLRGIINDMGVTWAFLTPSLVKTMKPEDIPGLELLLLTGETVSQDVFDSWIGNVRLATGWGPAETCVFSTLHEWKSADESPLTLGHPVGAFCWIVDPENPQQLTPVDGVGEVVIQGPTLLREYLADPESTEAAIVTDLPSWAPHRTSPHWNRFFKSGDLCAYNSSGSIKFVGRRDTQVKIQDFRVELDEVEYHLQTTLENVHQVMVDVLGENTEATLVAYFCAGDDTRPSTPTALDANALFLPLTPEIQSQIAAAVCHLNEILPSYMVPTIFLPCRFMPLITSTKIDRNGLRRLAAALPKDTLAQYTLVEDVKCDPITPMEERIRSIWASVLNIPAESIKPNDNFLSIGGDSIAAIRLVVQAQEMGLTITAKSVFADPRLSAVAAEAIEGKLVAILSETFSLLPAKNKQRILKAVREQCKLSSIRDIEDAYPCTSLQEGLMALALKQPGSYMAKYVYRIPSNIETAQFQSAWEQTVNHCENLRTRIVAFAGTSFQAVISECPPWEPTDDLDLDTFMDTFKGIQMEYGTQLCRFALVTEKTGERFFVLALHQAIFDEWSLNIVFETLHDIYRGKPVHSLEPFSSLIDHTSKLDDDAAKEYWSRQLSGAQPSTFPKIEMTTDSWPDSQIMTANIGFPEIANTSFTKAMILRAAWALVLSCYCDSDDICFGTTVLGRHVPVAGIDRIVGPALATVPIRVRLDREKPAVSFLEEIRQQASEMLEYEQYGIRNISRLGNDAREACKFSSLMVVHPRPIQPTNISSKTFLVPADSTTFSVEESVGSCSTYPLTLQAMTHKDHVELVFIYNPTVLSDPQLEALANHMEYVIQQLVSNGDEPLSKISLTSDWDFQKIIEWNEDKVTEVRSICVYDMIAHQASQAPDQQALCSRAGNLTYRELDEKSTNLAKHLVGLGLKPEMIVPTCFEKSIWAIVAQLAIMKAGGAFLPLDPNHPIGRRRAIISEVEAPFVLVSLVTAESFTLDDRIVLVSPSSTSSSLSGSKRTTFITKSGPNNAAYVFFTSGSSGSPKGVVVEQTALCSSIVGHGTAYGFGPHSRVLQFSNYVFDGSVAQSFTPLAFGGTVCVPSDEERLTNITKFIKDMKVNFADLTPSFVRTLSPSAVTSLETLVLSGEAPSRDIIETWFSHVKLINAYGPTECCVCSCTYEYESQTNSPTTIGYALNSRCWIVDANDHTRLAPVGCVGELVIQGPILARGYYNDPARTEESFIDDVELVPELSNGDPPRFYKTGDLVRYNFDGSIEYVGRKDTQVKIRGLRIELGEVEYQVGLSPDVYQTVVDVIDSDAGPSLVAYFSLAQSYLEPTDKREITAENIFLPLTPDLEEKIANILEHLNSTLPSYMVPTLFVPCKFLPSSTSAKLDRMALRTVISGMNGESLSRYAGIDGKKHAVRTPMEALSQNIWAQVLNRQPETIGRTDTFTGLGGDSITAIQMVTRLRYMGLTVTVQDVFASPRLSAFADKIVGDFREDQQPVEPFSMLNSTDTDAIKETIKEQCDLSSEDLIEDAYPCTSFQEGVMALAMKQPGSYIWKHVYCLPDHMDSDRFKAAWSHTVELCTALRTRIAMYKGTPIQAVIDEEVQWEPTTHTSLSSFREDMDIITYVHFGSRLCRYTFLTDSKNQRFFILSAHHAVMDVWSMDIMLRLLQKTYNDSSVPKLHPYSAFISYTTQIDRKAATSYWKKQLRGAQRAIFPATSLSTIYLTPVSQVTKTQIRIPELANGSITVPTILRSTWAMVLARYNKTDDICFGTTVSGRQAPIAGVESIVGSTAASLPIRVYINGQQRVESFLQEVQSQATEMVAYEQFGLKNIASISNEIKAVCDFASLLIIQPVQEVAKPENKTGTVLVQVTPEENEIEEEKAYFSYPLVATCLIYGDEIELQFAYHDNAISGEQIEALSHQFSHVFNQLCTQHDTQLDSISIASSWDVQQAAEWNKHEVEVIDSCVHQLIAERAKTQPRAEAISAWDGKLTYAQLNEAANRFANYLITSHGIQPGDFVPVCFEKSVWYTVAILGINKAGAAWVPIDPTHPAIQHQQIIEQTKAKIVVASEAVADIFVDLAQHIIKLTSDFDTRLLKQLQGSTKQSPQVNVTPSHPAYVIFTPGKSGSARGVVVHHRAICTSQKALAKRLFITPSVRLLQSSAHIFDGSVAEIFGALISGACVCVPSEHDLFSNLKEFINAAKVNWAYLAPTTARTLQPRDVPYLELLLLVGEAVTSDLLEIWFGMVRLLNGWGPTETCVLSSVHEWQSPDLPLAIGRPVGGLCWIVNPQNVEELSPIGCIGEIVVQGPTVFQGYLSDAAQTEAVIVKSLPKWASHSDVPYFDQFYKTGDLAFQNPDGTIEYVGRKDTQVKVRGLRVELAEIESSIKAAESNIASVVVDIIENESSESLAAFLTFSTEEDALERGNAEFELNSSILPLDPSVEQSLAILARELAATLPQYMIPDFFIPLKHMPFTSPTKIDRSTLRQQAGIMPRYQLFSFNTTHWAASCTPATELQHRLRSQWSDLLSASVESIGIYDDFYRLGGDSTQVNAVFEQINTEFNVSLSLDDLDDKSLTIHNLSELVEDADQSNDSTEVGLTAELSRFINTSQYGQHREKLLNNPLTDLPPGGTVFLTGATGYLGTEVLRRLLCLDAVDHVIVLVRAMSPQHGLERIRNTARVAMWWDVTETGKIEVWTGDLSRYRLGLKDSQWERLCGRSIDGNIDAIVHNGAVVDWNADYEKLRAPNVDSTAQLLSAAASSPLNAKMVYISSGAQTDSSLAVANLEHRNGYIQTKFLSESIIKKFSDQLPVQNRISTVKPALIIGTADKGVANRDHLVWRIVATAAELRAYPQEPDDHWLQVADVRTVAAAITGQLLTTDPINAFVDVAFRMPISAFWRSVNSELDEPCSPMPWDQWLPAAIARMEQVGESHPLWPMQHVLGHLSSPSASTGEAPKPLEVVPLQLAVRRNVSYLLDIGFIPSSMSQTDAESLA